MHDTAAVSIACLFAQTHRVRLPSLTTAGDTGGLVDTDWTSILWNKINWLQTVGLVPWYAYGQTPAASLPETSANSSSGWVDLLSAWQRQPCLNGAAAACTCVLVVVALLQQSRDSMPSSHRVMHMI